ncbi:MAG TPA: HPF/RaiA family ribosome-associated protein [Fimbriiglobus sp.]
MFVSSKNPGSLFWIDDNHSRNDGNANARDVRLGTVALARIPVVRGETPSRTGKPAVRPAGTETGGKTMKYIIKGHGSGYTQKVRDYVERRLQFALSRFDGAIRRVRADVTEAPADRPGGDYRFRVVVEFVPAGRVSLEDSDGDFYPLADRVVGWTESAVREELDRRRIGRPGPPVHAATMVPPDGRLE